MNIREIFNFKGSFSKIELKNEKEKASLKSEEHETLNVGQEIIPDLKNEWNQEYEIIYLSYVLEK